MDKPFVSRAGEKLCYALEQFGIHVLGLVCADFGCSTGGFTDCLLKNGALKVYSVDTSYGELAYSLRTDKRVVVLERINAMHVLLPEDCDFISIDVGWTKLSFVIPNALNNLKARGKIVALLKPQYELGKLKVEEGDLSQLKKRTIDDLTASNKNLNFIGSVESPIVGKRRGNKEYLLFFEKS